METHLKPDGFNEQRLHIMPEYMLKELEQTELTRHFYISDIGVFPYAQYHYRDRVNGCNAHILIFCTEGEGWIEFDDSRINLTANHLAIIPAGKSHRYGASSHWPWSIHWLHMLGDHAASLIELFDLSTSAVYLPLTLKTSFLEEFEHCYALLSNKTYHMPNQVHASHKIRQLLSSIGLCHSTVKDKNRSDYLENAIRFMDDHVDDSIKLSDIAKYTGLSKQHLIYLFNKETGFPPIDYFLRKKMKKASQLLDLTSLSIKEISSSLGISDVYYFSRLFKNLIGVSPRAYRNIQKG